MTDSSHNLLSPHINYIGWGRERVDIMLYLLEIIVISSVLYFTLFGIVYAVGRLLEKDEQQFIKWEQHDKVHTDDSDDDDEWRLK